MRVLLSTYGSRGDVEPLVGLAVRSRELGAQVRMCAPPDEEFADLPAGAGAEPVPVGPPIRSMVRLSSAADASRRVSEPAARFDPVAAAAEGCDALCPWQETADLDVVHTGSWILPDERPLPDGLVAFLDAGTPPVYVGLGSMRHVPQDIVRVAVEAVRARGRRVLVFRGWADPALIDDRDDCFAVVVHHGGAGTTTTAARAGVPQVVVPEAGDQSYLAGRVADLGIGAAHDGPAPTAGSLSAALTTALTPRTRARAAAVAGAIRTDGTTVAAKLLFDTVGRERLPASA